MTGWRVAGRGGGGRCGGLYGDDLQPGRFTVRRWGGGDWGWRVAGRGRGGRGWGPIRR